ncbi:hypothetical protein [Agaribacterium sp. ZY112]|uniref:hypothetical protein n=1 Tax=Agaribacterium sp. ZY112 TaxID=3233574 RepID=UPI0035266B2E
MSATEAYKKFLELYKHVSDSEKFAFTKTYLSQIPSQSEREELSQLIDLALAGLPAPPKKIVVLIHGIRTQGKWFNLLENEINKTGDFEVRHCKYGFFDGIRFWIPIPWLFRNSPVRKVQRAINTIIGTHPGAELCAVAHSNGTYILSKIIKHNPQFNFKKIILCGSIVDENHDWPALKSQDKNLFINDCGTKDIWPVLAKSSTFGYGASGRFGFNHPEITDRHHNFGHDGFFSKEFISQYWLPFLTEGKIEPSQWDIQRPDEKWHIQAIGLFPGFLLCLVLTTTLVISYFTGLLQPIFNWIQ